MHYRLQENTFQNKFTHLEIYLPYNFGIYLVSLSFEYLNAKVICLVSSQILSEIVGSI